jgi:glutamate synthase domain-containing protein 1
MCGIVGLLAKAPEFRQRLGEMLTPMLVCMGDRGPDSAGLAIFSSEIQPPLRQFSLFSSQRKFDWMALRDLLRRDTGEEADMASLENHAKLTTSTSPEKFRTWLAENFPQIHLLAVGRSIELYKDEGHPAEIAARYRFNQLTGSHAVGHTRMATESAVTPAHAHPYTAGEDFCLVHNGSLSNPWSLRRMLEKKGIHFETDNDTEAACRYLEWRMSQGDTLEEALQKAFTELDGFYTLLMATADKMVLVRDAFACKPAIIAETQDYVAVSSEFRSLAHLPGIHQARLFEPVPEEIYSWNV